MCGSGTVTRAAVEAGLPCIGSDIDPLSVLMARVWTTPVNIDSVGTTADTLARAARDLSDSDVKRTTDSETKRFISFWFGPDTRSGSRTSDNGSSPPEGANEGRIGDCFEPNYCVKREDGIFGT